MTISTPVLNIDVFSNPNLGLALVPKPKTFPTSVASAPEIK
jgi:hypothetical protein